ncbi:MAG: hypothetical protein MZV70_71190 [Desulfobacterales bacterium]|nr:hypothetical protein [Desulfobacterales bacterium]
MRIAFVSRVDNAFDIYVLQPADQPDRQADREQRPQRVAVLVARRPPPRLRLQPLGLDPALHRRLRRGQPPAADRPGREQAPLLDGLGYPLRSRPGTSDSCSLDPAVEGPRESAPFAAVNLHAVPGPEPVLRSPSR